MVLKNRGDNRNYRRNEKDRMNRKKIRKDGLHVNEDSKSGEYTMCIWLLASATTLEYFSTLSLEPHHLNICIQLMEFFLRHSKMHIKQEVYWKMIKSGVLP